jgi:hypothetical protein
MIVGPSCENNFKRPRGFGDFPFYAGAAATAPLRRGILIEKSAFKISSDLVRNGGMFNANVADIKGADGPLLETFV